MDETNPKDTTTNRATGANPAPAAPRTVPVDSAEVDKAAATISEHVVHSAPKTPVSPVPPVPPIPVPPPVPPPVQIPILPVPAVQPVTLPPQVPVPPVPPPVQPVPPPPTQNVPAGVGVESAVSEKPTPLAIAPAPKLLRDDIARIIGKIKLPERITLKMSGEQAKPPAPPTSAPPSPVDSSAKENAGGNGTPAQSPETPAQTSHQIEDAQKESGSASSIASVHTLKDDLQNVVRDKKMSLVRAVALESEKKKGQAHFADPHLTANKANSRKIIGIVFVATVFLALVGAAFFGVQSVLKQAAESAQPAVASSPSLMFAEGTFAFPEETRTGTDLKRALITEARKVPSIPLGAIVRIIPTSSETEPDGSVREVDDSIGDFLTAIETQATPELIRSFRGNFFFGLHKTTEGLAPVLIIPVTSYERAFAGMLAWEPTMSGDLSPVFSFIPPQTVDEKGLFVERQFDDALINNYDVRVLKDDSGATQLMYSFPTRTMLIISESPYSFTEVLSRLRASRQL